ncbi:hypothetical protein HMPREF3036_02545 [Sutterella sp. KLE1602]|nr:hypothetical protein HMPREF3036_02545 [Sutterella sp. KLE1602]
MRAQGPKLQAFGGGESLPRMTLVSAGREPVAGGRTEAEYAVRHSGAGAAGGVTQQRRSVQGASGAAAEHSARTAAS